MRLSFAVALVLSGLLLSTGTSAAAEPTLTIDPNGAFNADGTARIKVTLTGDGDDGILGAVPWVNSISIDGAAVRNAGANTGQQYVEGTNKTSGYITFAKRDFLPEKGKTYKITVTVKTKSGKNVTGTGNVTFN